MQKPYPAAVLAETIKKLLNDETCARGIGDKHTPVHNQLKIGITGEPETRIAKQTQPTTLRSSFPMTARLRVKESAISASIPKT